MFAANALVNQRFSNDELLDWAVEMEGHADNVVPAIMGGFTAAMMAEGKVFYQKILPPARLKLVLAVPDFVLPTHQSRSVLPETLSFSQSVSNLQKACFLVASMANQDFSQLQMAMDDQLIQPLRKSFIPGFDQVLGAARQAGAQGVALSGAGPSVIAFASDHEKEIGIAMQHAFFSAGIESRILNLNPSSQGIQILHK
jgi:homoserine kinase